MHKHTSSVSPQKSRTVESPIPSTSWRSQNKSYVSHMLSSITLSEVQAVTDSDQSRRSSGRRPKPPTKTTRRVWRCTDPQLMTYLKVLNLPTLQSKPILWSLHHTLLTIQHLYSSSFRHTNWLLKHNKLAPMLSRPQSFLELLWTLFEERYKTHKLASYNLGNLVYSLLKHLEKSQQEGVWIFHAFLAGYYGFQEFVYFLFVRSCVERELGSLTQLAQRRERTASLKAVAIGRREALRLVRNIAGGNQEVEDGLKQVLGEEFGGWERVELHKVFRVMLEDYKKKREGERREGVEEGDNGQGESSQGSPASRQNSSQYFSNHLGQENSSLRQDDNNTQQKIPLLPPSYPLPTFWLDAPTSPNHTPSTLQLTLLSKLSQKITDLLSIMYTDSQDAISIPRGTLHHLLQSKTQLLVGSIFTMDRMEWLQLLRIEQPTKGQLENVEELQLMVRELKRGWVEKLASEFCKKVLMTEELKREMERLIVGA